MLFRGTQDGRVLAYDFKTGKRIWETTIADPKLNESVPSAPIAWDGLVFVGNAGGDFKGAKGHMYALDAKTGKIVWEFFLVPKSRGRRRPRTARRERRSTCRPGKTRPAYRSAAAGSWTSYTLDTKTGLLYVPGGNPAPDFASARARERIFIPTRSSCSTPRPGTTNIISSLCRKTGTTGTSPTRPILI